MKPQTIQSELLYQGKILDLYKDNIRLENGTEALREVVRHKKAACVFAYDDRHAYLAEQYRHPMNANLLEIAAGLCKDGEAPETTAKRELQEELNAVCEDPVFLGEFYSSPGFCDEIIYMYAAKIKGFQQGTQDEDEFVTTKKIPISQLYNMIDNGEIKDGKTIAAVCKFRCLNQAEKEVRMKSKTI